jgi:hypothetical protein
MKSTKLLRRGARRFLDTNHAENFLLEPPEAVVYFLHGPSWIQIAWAFSAWQLLG